MIERCCNGRANDKTIKLPLGTNTYDPPLTAIKGSSRPLRDLANWRDFDDNHTGLGMHVVRRQDAQGLMGLELECHKLTAFQKLCTIEHGQTLRES